MAELKLAIGVLEAMCPEMPYPGSTLLPCEKCGRTTWAGPTIQQVVRSGVPLYCFACAALTVTATGVSPVPRVLTKKPSPVLARSLERFKNEHNL